MKRRTADGKWVLCVLMLWVILVRLLSGCGSLKKEGREKLRDLDAQILSEEEIPPDLKAAIEERKAEGFRLTYSDETSTYLAVGYGQQESAGCSIALRELSLWPNAVHLDTELLGPEPGAADNPGATGNSGAADRKKPPAGTTGSCPYIVIRTEYREEPVVFQ